MSEQLDTKPIELSNEEAATVIRGLIRNMRIPRADPKSTVRMINFLALCKAVEVLEANDGNKSK